MTRDDARVAELAEQVAQFAADDVRQLVLACSAVMGADGQAVLENIERMAQQVTARIGRQVISGVVNLAGEHTPATTLCDQAHRARLVQSRPKTIQTLLGTINIERGYYHCGQCHTGFAPLDDKLGVRGNGLSPGLTRACALAGMEMPYLKSTQFIEEVTGQRLASASTINRVTISEGTRARNQIDKDYTAKGPRPIPPAWVEDQPDKCYIVLDGTGAPMLPSETRGHLGKNQDQAKTREVKIGCYFTQSGLDFDNQPAQDPNTTTYISTFDPVGGFSDLVKAEYHRRGFDQIRQPIVIGDGAKWIWGVADQRIPHATQIVDYYHAREHLAGLVKLVTPLLDDPTQWSTDLINALDQGDTTSIVDAVDRLDLPSRAPHLVQDANTEVGYFTGNHHRMQYAHFKAKGYFIGSGFVESACNTLVKQRAKRAGMHWTIRGLDPVIALRTLHQSGRTELIWNTPTSRQAAK